MGKKPKCLKGLYDCEKCPAYCCSYERVIVSRKDIRRLAEHHGLSFDKARKKLTKKGEEKGERVLRHRRDEIYGTVCRFLDQETRQCTVYDARPGICRGDLPMPDEDARFIARRPRITESGVAPTPAP